MTREPMFGLGIQENDGQKSEYGYVVKYKIPPFTGDSVEELRVTLKENHGFPCGWHNCRYNGKDIRVYTAVCFKGQFMAGLPTG